ncbi:MAG TPA: adenylate/guanylate cyclase domain-containing protein [Nitrososphaerales archaeon]|nr:adenylate/guanylate cyclase domain-containing protein [Nitrososphaerales archaeon]
MSDRGRRLSAIMFADMPGYTSLSQRNEPLALKLVEETRSVVRPLFQKHEGREVKTMGDGFLVEFPSALEAVRCAYVVQESLNEYSARRSGDERLSLRIGIHVGDVVHDGTDVMGDAVNVASRIEPQAAVGGICVSRQVYDQVRNHFEFPLVSMGSRQLKGVQVPVEVFSVSLPWMRGEEVPSNSLDRLRLAVLPLANYSQDPNDAYFADGMTEELISTISRIKGLRVIARTSIMHYKDQSKRISDIGRELGAGTIIEGSVRKAGDTVKITVQLIDSSSEEHLWADDYERKLENVFQIQRDIAGKVADGLKLRLLPEEKKSIEKPQTHSTEAFTLYLKGRYYWNERTEEALKKAEGYFQRAIELDPTYARAYAGLADTYSLMIFNGTMPGAEGRAKSKALVKKALEIDDSLAEAHTSFAFTGEDNFDWDVVEERYRKALSLNPSYATAHFWYGIVLMWRHKFDEAIEQSRQAEELDPLSPAISIALGQALVYARRYQEGIAHLEEKLRDDPNLESPHFILAIAFQALEDYKRCEQEALASIAMGGRDFRPLAMLASALAKQGRTSEAREILSELERRGAAPSILAIVHLELGEKEEAMRFMQEAEQVREPGLAWISIIPDVDPLRSDPRFKQILSRMRLPT